MGHDPDDNGLPPVDMDIPDDARELDREVQAYHRELRWHRRRERWRAALSAVRRFGVTAPLMGGALLIAAASAAVLVLTTRPGAQSPQQSFQQPPAEQSQSVGAGQIGGPLPDVRVTLGTTSRSLRELSPAVLALVPGDCRCAAALQDLTRQARTYGVPIYLVESGQAAPERDRLVDRIGESGQRPVVVDERQGALARAYGVSGLTTILVDREGRVSTVLHAAEDGTDWSSQLEPLRGSWQQSGDNAPAPHSGGAR